MKTQKIETWLPCFSGFYGTIWETDESLQSMIEDDFCDGEVEFIQELLKVDGIEQSECKELVAHSLWDNIDNRTREIDIVKRICEKVESELLEMKLIKSLEYQSISSPREYNFANDSGNISIVLCQANINRIHKYLKDNYEAFRVHVKDNYTSCDGFISSYSAYASDWLNKNDEDYFLNDSHKLGAILQFILNNEYDDYELDLYYDVEINEFEYINYEGMIADWLKEKAYGKYLIDNNETRSYNSLCVFEIQYVKLSH